MTAREFFTNVLSHIRLHNSVVQQIQPFSIISATRTLGISLFSAVFPLSVRMIILSSYFER